MVLLAHFELATIFFCAMFCRGVAKAKRDETMVGLTKITKGQLISKADFKVFV